MNQKCALITGASRGIGRAAAITFAAAGYNLAITCSKDIKGLKKTIKEIENYPVNYISDIFDIGNYNDCNNFIKKVIERFGNIDVLVNNAGISHISLLQDMTFDEWNKIISTNLTSVFNCCNSALPSMLHNKKGSIINISSVWGNVGASCEVAYSASKGGINAFTKALGKELAPSGIRVNAIACGAVDTAMNHCFSDEDIEALNNEIPAGRFASTKEVAELILDIAQNHPYLTGQVITLDGGWT